MSDEDLFPEGEGIVPYKGNKEEGLPSFADSIKKMIPDGVGADKKRRAILATIARNFKRLREGDESGCLPVESMPGMKWLHVPSNDLVVTNGDDLVVLFSPEAWGKSVKGAPPPKPQLVLLSCAKLDEEVIYGEVGKKLATLGSYQWQEHEDARKEAQKAKPAPIPRVFLSQEAVERLLPRCKSSEGYTDLLMRMQTGENRGLVEGSLGRGHSLTALSAGVEEMVSNVPSAPRVYYKIFTDVDGVKKMMVFLIGDKDEQTRGDKVRVGELLEKFKKALADARQAGVPLIQLNSGSVAKVSGMPCTSLSEVQSMAEKIRGTKRTEGM